MKCENCDNPATVHLTEIHGKKKSERHLCVDCVQKILPSRPLELQKIDELMKKFVEEHTQMPQPPDGTGI